MKKSHLLVILVVLLTTGTLNTILSKSQDHVCVDNCEDKKNEICYVQPAWQAIVMFIGEILCLFVYFFLKRMHQQEVRRKSLTAPLGTSTKSTLDTLLDESNDEERKKMTGTAHALMCIPACCDIFGTSIMMLSLTYLSGSIFQMLRGAVVIFTAITSVLFLKAKLPIHKWCSLGVIALALLIVGLFPGESLPTGACGEGHDETSKKDMLIVGVLLVLLSQVFTACQFVAEEKIMTKYKLPPIKAVGLEGVFGFSISVMLLAILNFAVANNADNNWLPATKRMFDFGQGLHDTFGHSTRLTLMSVGSIFAIAFFNFCGLSITKAMSCTARSTLDMCRTLFVWLFTLIAGWEGFSWPQLVGFAVLVYGTFLFNGVVAPPQFLRPQEPVTHDDKDLASIDSIATNENEAKVSNTILFVKKDENAIVQ